MSTFLQILIPLTDDLVKLVLAIFQSINLFIFPNLQLYSE